MSRGICDHSQLTQQVDGRTHQLHRLINSDYVFQRCHAFMEALADPVEVRHGAQESILEHCQPPSTSSYESSPVTTDATPHHQQTFRPCSVFALRKISKASATRTRLTYGVQVHKRLLEPHGKQPLPLARFAAIQQTIYAHIFIPSQLERVRHQVQRLERRCIELHVLREVVVKQLELAVKAAVCEKGKIRQESCESGHGLLELELSCTDERLYEGGATHEGRQMLYAHQADG